MIKVLKNHAPLQRFLYILISLLYFSFIALDFLGQQFSFSSDLKWLSIGLIAILQNLDKKTVIAWKLAAWLTVICDFSLLFNHKIVLGVLLFCGVHALRIYVVEEKWFWRILSICSLILFVSILQKQIELGILLMYVFLLIFMTGLTLIKKKRQLTIAYLLFISCDLCVAFGNLVSQMTISQLLLSLSWLFYIPSQLLLIQTSEEEIH